MDAEAEQGAEHEDDTVRCQSGEPFCDTGTLAEDRGNLRVRAVAAENRPMRRRRATAMHPSIPRAGRSAYRPAWDFQKASTFEEGEPHDDDEQALHRPRQWLRGGDLCPVRGVGFTRQERGVQTMSDTHTRSRPRPERASARRPRHESGTRTGGLARPSDNTTPRNGPCLHDASRLEAGPGDPRGNRRTGQWLVPPDCGDVDHAVGTRWWRCVP